jgi:hypothetical protein
MRIEWSVHFEAVGTFPDGEEFFETLAQRAARYHGSAGYNVHRAGATFSVWASTAGEAIATGQRIFGRMLPPYRGRIIEAGAVTMTELSRQFGM